MESKIETGGPAFPGEKDTRFGQPNDCNEGMTLRDYFAAKAIGPLLVTATPHDAKINPEIIASGAYLIADAMIKERAKP